MLLAGKAPNYNWSNRYYGVSLGVSGIDNEGLLILEFNCVWNAMVEKYTSEYDLR
jgi:hypothetical protein